MLIGTLARRLVPVLACWLAAVLTPALAQQQPAAFVDGVIGRINASIKSSEAALAGDRAIAAAAAIVERDVASHMDFGVITREATGRAWETASAAQKAALVREFRALLIHVLARLLVTNRADTLNATPAQTAADARDAVVKVAVTRPRAAGSLAQEPMLVTLRRSSAEWKVHELRTDGVDVVKLYSANFAVVIERQGGIDGLIRTLEERNARNAQAAVAPQPALTPRVLVDDACIGCASP